MNVNTAVRRLRKHRHQTQQQFATELGMSISGLQNYERDQMPEPRQLSIFLDCAQKFGPCEVAKVFRDALQRSLAVPYSSLFYGPSPSNRVEYSFNAQSIDALHQCLAGHADYADVAPLVMRAVAEAIEGLAERENDPARVKQLRKIRPKSWRKDK
jgi:transcriptional regulator with XRE-family HTH domain